MVIALRGCLIQHVYVVGGHARNQTRRKRFCLRLRGQVLVASKGVQPRERGRKRERGRARELPKASYETHVGFLIGSFDFEPNLR